MVKLNDQFVNIRSQCFSMSIHIDYGTVLSYLVRHYIKDVTSQICNKINADCNLLRSCLFRF